MSERRGARVVRGFTGGVAALLLALALGGDVSAQAAPDRGEPEPSVDITRIDWMTGCWRASDGGEELWTDGRGGQMLGLSRTWRDGRAVRWEFLDLRGCAVTPATGGVHRNGGNGARGRFRLSGARLPHPDRLPPTVW